MPGGRNTQNGKESLRSGQCPRERAAGGHGQPAGTDNQQAQRPGPAAAGGGGVAGTRLAERSQVNNPGRQIPVIVLAGFLGSGKTTLLNHLLRASRGTRIGAIVNDFGSIEIDAMTVAGRLGDSTVSLGGGRLCCAVDSSELDRYLDKLTRPAARLDVIVIEASGLAEPQELLKMLLASENPRIVYGGLVEVIDAAEYEATREHHPEIERHVAIADLVVLNKTDRVDAGDLARLRASLPEAAAVVESAYGRVDPELFFDRRPVTERVGQLAFDDLLDDVLDDLPGGEEPGRSCGHDPHGRLPGPWRAPARRVHVCRLHLAGAPRPAPPHGLPGHPARRPLPRQGIHRLRRRRSPQPLQPARGRPVPALLPRAVDAAARSAAPTRPDRRRHRRGRPGSVRSPAA